MKYERLKIEDERSLITYFNLRESDKGRAKGIMIELKKGEKE
jgi:hypothetical protein